MLESNSSAEQLGIYAGVAGAGAIAGAAVVARVTSPLYKKEKKGKSQGKNTGAVNNPMKLATPVPLSQRATLRNERNAKKSRSPNSNIDEMYKNAVDGPRADFGADAEFARQAQANQAGWEQANNVNDRGQLLLDNSPNQIMALPAPGGPPDVIHGGYDDGSPQQTPKRPRPSVDAVLARRAAAAEKRKAGNAASKVLNVAGKFR